MMLEGSGGSGRFWKVLEGFLVLRALNYFTFFFFFFFFFFSFFFLPFLAALRSCLWVRRL